jgi:NADH dehydrogenase/NADH:ubiquinone oxidoreductase subunit G
MQYVTLTIDGTRVKTEKGMSVLDAAVKHGICIPHLCHIPGLTDMGGCRLCIVEDVRNGRSKITASCTLTAQEGMVIRTNTDKIRRLRKNLAELLVAQAPNSKAVQDIAVRCGVTEVRYPFRNEDCILCGRCVRFCRQMARANALGFIGRGKDRHVDHPPGQLADFCKQCNACILYCPMSVTPCGGPMKPGEERLCGQCDSQLTAFKDMPGVCVWCDLGKGFQCSRYLQT